MDDTKKFNQLLEKIKTDKNLNLQQIIDSPIRGNCLLNHAAWASNFVVVKRLLKENVNVLFKKSDGSNALYWVCKHNRTSMCELLMQHGADPNVITGAYNDTTLTRAAFEGNRQIMEYILNLEKKFEHSFDWVCDYFLRCTCSLCNST